MSPTSPGRTEVRNGSKTGPGYGFITCATKLLRGELYEAVGMLAFFREQILGPMFHREAGRPQRGVRRIEQDAHATAALA